MLLLVLTSKVANKTECVAKVSFKCLNLHTFVVSSSTTMWSYKFKTTSIQYIFCKSLCNHWLIHSLSVWSSHVLGACFLISSNDALISWRWRLGDIETSETVVPPEWLWSGWGDSRLVNSVGWSRCCGQSRSPRQCGLAPLLCFPGNLAAVEKRMESGDPEVGFVPHWVQLILGRILAVKAEGSAD